jgi:hypothetical protein
MNDARVDDEYGNGFKDRKEKGHYA